MAYLVTAHVFRGVQSTSALAELPKSIGYRLYLHRTANLLLLDTFRPNKMPPYPFQALLPSADLPLELPPELQRFERLYAHLRSSNIANGFKKSYLQFALLLSRILRTSVFSFATDDDTLDFTCSAKNGAFARLKCQCDDLLVSGHEGIIQIAPLVTEDDDENMLTDVDALAAAVPGIHVLPRETPWPRRLHAIAMEELQAFSGIEQTILGLGSFDPPADEDNWELVAQR